MKNTTNENKPKSGQFIFRASITLKDGTKILAKQYGLKAFKIYI